MDDKPLFYVLAQRRIKPDQLEAFLETDDKLLQDATTAKGFRKVFVLQSLEEPHFVTHFEEWDSQAAHDDYVMDSAHKGFEEAIQEMVFQVQDPKHYILFKTYQGTPFRPVATQQRLPVLGDEQLKDETRARLKKLPALTFFRTVANAQDYFDSFMRLADAILHKGELNVRLREFLILGIAVLEGAQYEFIQHQKLAMDAGITKQQIEAIAVKAFTAPILNEDERLMLRIARHYTEQGVLPEALFNQMKARFSPQELSEIMIICGFYQMAARIMLNAGLVPEAAPAKEFNY